MKKIHLFAAMAAVAAVSLGGIASAGAAPAGKSQAEILGPVRAHDDGTATVKARYICPEGSA